jgi:hypothetical protein
MQHKSVTGMSIFLNGYTWKNTLFWNVTPCSLALPSESRPNSNQASTSLLLFASLTLHAPHGGSKSAIMYHTTRRHTPEDSIQHFIVIAVRTSDPTRSPFGAP